MEARIDGQRPQKFYDLKCCNVYQQEAKNQTISRLFKYTVVKETFYSLTLLFASFNWKAFIFSSAHLYLYPSVIFIPLVSSTHSFSSIVSPQ